MQTFLPYADFGRSAAALDRQRLGKQRLEAKQLLRALLGQTRGWRNHPAARMWRGHEAQLALYGLCVCWEWCRRGYRDAQAPWFEGRFDELPACDEPPWLGDDAFHASHRSNLLRKSPEWYGQLGWSEPHDLPYIWPDSGAGR